MLNILLLSRYDRMGASSRLRHLQYIPHLKDYGIRVTAAPFFDDRYIIRLNTARGRRPDHVAWYYLKRLTRLLKANRYDLIWLEKELLPWFPEWVELPLLRKHPYVLDLDDAWFIRYQQNESSRVRRLLWRKMDALVRQAAVVIVGNSVLEDWARGAGASRVVKIPTAVDLFGYPPDPLPDRHTFTIGWIGQPATAAYLQRIACVLREACGHPGTTFRLIGANHIDLHGVSADRRSWSERCEAVDLASIDVGIMPLDDGPWERAKSGFKLIQYMAASRPVVASRVGANAEIVDNGITGFLVNDDREWLDALSFLRRERNIARQMGLNGRALVTDRFTVGANKARLAEALHAASR